MTTVLLPTPYVCQLVFFSSQPGKTPAWTVPTGCHSRPSPGGSATPALLMSNLHAQPFRCLSLFSLLCHHLLQLPELFCPPHTTNHLTLNGLRNTPDAAPLNQHAGWPTSARPTSSTLSVTLASSSTCGRNPSLYLCSESQPLPVSGDGLF